MALSERSEFDIFREKRSGMKALGSYRVWSRWGSFLAYFFCGQKKWESIINILILK